MIQRQDIGEISSIRDYKVICNVLYNLNQIYFKCLGSLNNLDLLLLLVL